jgi:prepilin-type N-terminal cleavage/methylation domain-containing protein
MNQSIAYSRRGFTLVEILVSLGLFAIVVLVAVGALLSLTGANRKAQALQSVMNNLNVTVDGMVRNMRDGNTFYCGINGGTSISDCASSPGTAFSFTTIDNKRWIYRYAASGDGICTTQSGAGGCIEKSIDGGTSYTAVTAPEVSITDMKFYVIGTDRMQATADTTQPKVVIVIKGTAGGGTVKVQTKFHLQATAVQRVLDI